MLYFLQAVSFPVLLQKRQLLLCSFAILLKASKKAVISVRLCVSLSVLNNLAPTEKMFMKSDVLGFFENRPRKFKTVTYTETM